MNNTRHGINSVGKMKKEFAKNFQEDMKMREATKGAFDAAEEVTSLKRKF